MKKLLIILFAIIIIFCAGCSKKEFDVFVDFDKINLNKETIKTIDNDEIRNIILKYYKSYIKQYNIMEDNEVVEDDENMQSFTDNYSINIEILSNEATKIYLDFYKLSVITAKAKINLPINSTFDVDTKETIIEYQMGEDYYKYKEDLRNEILNLFNKYCK